MKNVLWDTFSNVCLGCDLQQCWSQHVSAYSCSILKMLYCEKKGVFMREYLAGKWVKIREIDVVNFVF